MRFKLSDSGLSASRLIKIFAATACCATFCATSPSALAEDLQQQTPAVVESTVDVMSAIRGEVEASDRVVKRFERMAGSHRNAQSLVVGLRNAKAVKIVATSAKVKAASFMPPTQPMSFSDVHTALSLAQAQLKFMRISKPSPEQIKASLAGGELPDAHNATINATTGAATGTTIQVVGILPLHQRGMSWDDIARTLNVAMPKPLNPVKPVATNNRATTHAG